MERKKVTLGARILTESEIKKTLATYDTIFNQIELFRENVEELSEKDIDMTPQKINNIAILGKRGTGKTSILRTIRETLKKEDKKDILLPIIIPENMSQNNSLMSSIIGMFSDIVKQYKNENYVNDCIGNRKAKNELEEKYNDVVKQFCYIQPQYKHILMDNFISELEYTKKSSQIFNADQEFIKKFHRFINALLKNCEEKKSMIFVFIDDIDLSTNRCMDVVKTLLSYISHPNIVTFLSGDLDTFEEAIAIDFLRQEQAFSEKVWNGKFINETSLLERKKELAYEYLKKVAPPIYRHNIKYWSLKDRGNYFIAQNEEDTSKEITLYKMLRKLEEKEFQKERFFTMYSEQETDKVLPLTYHLFDETARGLNNVYAVLYDMYQKWINEKDIDYTDKRNLIDTMISANPVLNGLRNNIDSIVHFNNDNESVDILYDNFIIYIDRTIEYIKDIKYTSNDEISEILQKNSKNRKDMFVLFLLLEFIKKIFKKINVTLNSYIIAKNKTIQILLLTPSLHESSALMTSETAEYAINITKEFDKKENKFFNIIKECLTKGDFLFAINFYEKLIDRSYNFYTEFKFDKFGDKIELFIKIEQALKAFLYQEEKDNNKIINYLAENFHNFKYSFDEIQNILLGNKKTLTSELLFSDIICREDVGGIKLYNKIKCTTSNTHNYETIHERLRKKLLYNYFIEYYEKTIFDLDNKTNQILGIKSIEQNEFLVKDKSFNEKEKEKYQKQYDIIKKIDANKLWDSSIFKDKPLSNLITNIYKYLEKEVELLEEILINENFNEKKKNFYLCCTGTSNYITIADYGKFELQIIEKEYEYKSEDETKEKLTRKYIDIQKECDILYNVFSGSGWYAKEETRALYNAIHELAWYKEQNHEDQQKNKQEAIFKLHLYFYALYKSNTMKDKNYMNTLTRVTEFDNIINKARELYAKSEKNKFTEQINNENLEIDMKDIETLFIEEYEENEEGES